MKTHHIFRAAVTAFLVFLAGCAAPHETVTLGTLLSEMTDREAITRYPSPYYTCAQFSSYDRATVEPGDKSWFANWDRSMFVRVEENGGRKEYVMMDAAGPGAIVRFWMTFAGEGSGTGTLRIYVDGEPVVEGPAFDIISGGALAPAPLSESVSHDIDYGMRGHNLYLPIPYSGHCKVTYESDNIKDFGAKTGGEAVYYNINYRTYEEGTVVESFSPSSPAIYAAEITEACRLLDEKQLPLPAGARTETLSGVIEPGESREIDITGRGQSIRKLVFALSADDLPQALRSTVIRLSFDGKTTVECPIGDFFGTGYNIRQFDTWYSSVAPDGTMTSVWVMPFRKECTVSVENMGTQQVTITKGEIMLGEYNWTKNSMYFGSSWKQFTALETGEMKNNEGDGEPFDITYVELQGKGVYAGDGLVLFNTVYAWWGEGDEKVYVDGEPFPSHIGTGTEDYYGYAWCRPEKFTGHPFIAQPDGSGNFAPGYTVNLRYRALDAIPFGTSLRFDMEMWHWTKAIINFAPVTYWYISPGDVRENISELDDAALPVVHHRKQLFDPAIRGGKVEGENLVLYDNPNGVFRYENNVTRGWSNNMQAVWYRAAKGDRLIMGFESGEGGAARVSIVHSKGADYGRFAVRINDGPAKVLDAHAAEFAVDTFDFGNTGIVQGTNYVTFELLSGGTERTKLGIDCIAFD